MNAITEIKTVLSAVKTTGDSKQEKLCPQSHPLYSPKTPRCHQSLRLGPNGESFCFLKSKKSTFHEFAIIWVPQDKYHIPRQLDNFTGDLLFFYVRITYVINLQDNNNNISTCKIGFFTCGLKFKQKWSVFHINDTCSLVLSFLKKYIKTSTCGNKPRHIKLWENCFSTYEFQMISPSFHMELAVFHGKLK